MATDCHFSDTRALNNGEGDVIIMVKNERKEEKEEEGVGEMEPKTVNPLDRQ